MKIRRAGLLALLVLVFVLSGCGDGESHEGEAKTPSGSSAQKGRQLEEVIRDFEDKGFTNVRTEAIEDLVTGWLTKDGEVEGVSVGGDEGYSPDKWVAADTEVIIKYHTFPSKDEEATTAEAEETTEDDKPDEIAETEATSDNNSAIADSDNDSGVVSDSENEMPIMIGSSLDNVIAVAELAGLSRVFDDEDYGHGTKRCSLATSQEGLSVDVIYSTATKEVLCGRVITSEGLYTTDDQKTFIGLISRTICPMADGDEVTSWVEANVGGAAETSINGFVYEVALGPNGNCLYYAGYRNWEEWELSNMQE